MACPVCSSGSEYALATPRRSFLRCAECGFAWSSPSSRPDSAASRERYLLHRNEAGDPEYVGYLSGIIDQALSRVEAGSGASVRLAVDWGSGPNPVCASLLRARGLEVSIWDPFFADGAPPAAGSSDLVLCIEVAEHFLDPVPDFMAMAACLRPGGYAAVHTRIAPEDDAAFLRWWYIEDPTHVSFYSERSLRLLSRRASLSLREVLDGRLSIFSRPLPVLVAGGANLDMEGRSFAALVAGDSNPGRIRFAPGGAARNVAENLVRLGIAAELSAAVGADAAGRDLEERTAASGIGTAGVERMEGSATSCYLSILDDEGEMALALSSMEICDRFVPEYALASCVRAAAAASARSFVRPSSVPFSALMLDGNLLPATVEALLDRFPDTPAWFDPVSTTKARRFAEWRSGALVGRFAALKPNRVEADAMGAALLRRTAGVLYVSQGPEGVSAAGRGAEFRFKPPAVEVVSATGAGDAFLAGALRAILLGDSIEESVVQGCAASSMALASSESCPPGLSAVRAEDIVGRWRRSGVVAGKECR